jgi:hypothetical protein
LCLGGLDNSVPTFLHNLSIMILYADQNSQLTNWLPSCPDTDTSFASSKCHYRKLGDLKINYPTGIGVKNGKIHPALPSGMPNSRFGGDVNATGAVTINEGCCGVDGPFVDTWPFETSSSLPFLLEITWETRSAKAPQN